MMKFTIQRSNWLRGEPDESCLLRSSDGKMCCLGFLAIACGFSPDDIRDIQTPVDVVQAQTKSNWVRPPSFPDGIQPGTANNSQVGESALRNIMSINDLYTGDDEDEWSRIYRESKLSELFGSINIEVEFVD